jgi:hypothetical protein
MYGDLPTAANERRKHFTTMARGDGIEDRSLILAAHSCLPNRR